MKTRTPRWPAAAAALAGAVPRSRLHPAVVAWAQSRPAREGWAVALSGGADSVALLLLLWAHWPARRERLVALHFDHRLRGRASAADARFCGRLCAGLGVNFVPGRWDARRKDPGAAGARAARFDFFARRMGPRRLRVLWLGHQQDDVAESLLMRLARGSGAGGLSAPRPVHAVAAGRKGTRAAFHVRPLLTLRKAELAAALRSAGGAWREDASNVQDVHFRNRVRRRVLPAWARAAGRDAVAGAARSRELLEEDDEALEAWADELGAISAERALDLRALAARPRALVRRVLHRWLRAQSIPSRLSRQGFEALLGAVIAAAPTRHSLGNHGFAAIRRGKLVFESSRKPRTAH